MKETKIMTFFTGMLFLAFMLNLVSAINVDANYVTFYPGEEGRVSVTIDNTENFDIENIVISLNLNNLPFTSIGSSSKDIDDINEDDDDSVSFTLKPSTDITPGDYSIPYEIKYVNADDNSENFTKEGNFGVRVSARTDLDFSAETRDVAIVGEEGQISIEVINQGLGEIKSVSVQILPNGFELLSGDKVFIGTINADDSDTATFNVVYRVTNPVFSAVINYKDFDNKDSTQTISLPLKVYTQEQALQLGLTSKSRTWLYLGIVIVLLILWYSWRRIRKSRQRKQKEKEKMTGR
jgi:hypothetical protein